MKARKVISLCLSLLMVLSTLTVALPTAVFAADTDETASLMEAADYYIVDAQTLASSGLVTIGGSNLEYKGLVTGTDANGYMSKCVRIAPKSSSVGTKAANTDFFFMYLPKEASLLYKDYPYVAVGYKANIPSNTENGTTINFVVGISEKSFATGDDKFFYPGTKITSGNVTTKLVQNSAAALKDGTAPNHKFLRITPYLNAKSAMTADDFFDIEYIGYFKTVEAANAYTHTYPTYTITYNNADGSLNSTQTVSSLEKATTPGSRFKKGADGNKYMTVWHEEGSEVYYSGEFTPSGDMTLIPEDVEVHVYDGQEIYNNSAVHSTGLLDVLTTGTDEDGKTYFRASNGTTATKSNSCFRFTLPSALPTASVETVLISAKDYFVPSSTSTNTTTGFNIYFPISTTYGYNPSDPKFESARNTITNDIRSTLYSINVTPATLDTSLTNDGTAGSRTVSRLKMFPWEGTTGTVGSYVDIYWIAIIANDAAAACFDYDAYLDSLSYTVTILNSDGSVKSTARYSDGATISLKPVQSGDQLFAAIYEDVDTGDTYTDSYTVSKNITLKPANSEPVSYVIFSSNDGTLDTSPRSDGTYTMNDLGTQIDTDGTKYERFTPRDSDTVAKTGVKILYSAGNENLYYKDYPYVVYGYRTNIATGKWNICFSYSDTDYKGTIFGQGISSGITTDGTWSKVYHKPEAFGLTDGSTFTEGTDYPLVSSYVMPYNSVKGSPDKTADDYFDLAYVAFFSDEDYAAAFDFEEYNKAVVTFNYGKELDSSAQVTVSKGTVLSSDIYPDSMPTSYVDAVDGKTYAITGWTLAGSSEPVADGYTISSNVTLNAVYEVYNFVNVTFIDADSHQVTKTLPEGAYKYEQIAAFFTEGFTSQYKDSNNDYYVLSGWKDENDNEYGINCNITANATLTAQYKQTRIYPASALTKETISLQISSDGGGKDMSLVTGDDGNKYLRISIGEGTKHGARLEWTLSDAPTAADVGAVTVKYATTTALDLNNTTNPRYHRLGFLGVSGVGEASGYMYHPYLADYKGSNVYSGIATFEMPDGVYADTAALPKIKYAFFTDMRTGFAYNFGPTAAPLTMDIEYIAFFNSTESASVFDYSKYKTDMTVSVTALIDGVSVAFGSYTYLDSVTLPTPSTVPSGKIFVGYLNSTGNVVTSFLADGTTPEFTTLYRNELTKSDYINYRGSFTRFKDAIAGKTEVKVAFLGGSVTVGQGSSSTSNRWTSRVVKYLNENVEGKTFTEINHNLGGTGSRLGSFRFIEDLELESNPDIVFIEFAGNDDYCGEDDYPDKLNSYNGKYYEYMIRYIRENYPSTEIVAVYITDSTRKANHPVASAQDAIAQAYGITSVNVGKYLYNSIFDKDEAYSTNKWLKFVTDGVHPNDYGYAVYAELIDYAFENDSQDSALTPASPVYADSVTYSPYTVEFSALTDVIGFTGADGTVISGFGSVKFANMLKATADVENSFSFTFEGTELSLYMQSPNAEATISVTVDETTVTQTGRQTTNAPKVFFENLENTTHTATVTVTGVTSNGNVLGICVGKEVVSRTVVVSATEGGQVSRDGTTWTDSFTASIVEGGTIELYAKANDGYKLRNWYDITNGQNTPLQKDNENIGVSDYSIVYTVNAGNTDMIISANFIPTSVEMPVRLIAYVSSDKGQIKVGSSDRTVDVYDGYASPSDPVSLTAIAADGYKAAYWYRYTQSSGTKVLVATGNAVNAYALGSEVGYVPEFVSTSDTVTLYIDDATNEIISVGSAPAQNPIRNGYTFNGWQETTENDVVINKTQFVKSQSSENNVFTVKDHNGNKANYTGSENKLPAFGEGYLITKSADVSYVKWIMTIGGSDYVVSYDDEFTFNYMFKEGTVVEVKENKLEADGAQIEISTVAAWTDTDSKTHFTGAYYLPSNYTLVERGILMASESSLLVSVAVNAGTGELEIPNGVILGRVDGNKNIFTVTKNPSANVTTWYGRAYVVYKDAEGNQGVALAGIVS